MKEEINNSSAMCGGVISQSLFDSDPMAYMMAYTLPDEHFKKYKEYKENGQEKEASRIFDKYSYSAIS